VEFLLKNLRATGMATPEKYLPFIGTLFIFIAASGLLTMIPGYIPPTSSLSTTAALALCVFVAVPTYAIIDQGIGGFLKHYVQPSIFMLPFNLISDITRVLALAVRLFGNTMSGTMIAGILILIAPLFFPVLFEILGLITSLIQAYIFSVLATVYIAAVTHTVSQKRGGAHPCP
jgi:F-type H+-transporting ATPase subunit a